MNIRFVSSKGKIRETISILSEYKVKVIPVQERLVEIQIEDTNDLLRDKVVKAFSLTGRPVFVEHTGLYLDALNGLPGGLTRVFWERIGEERFCNLFGKCSTPGVTAKTIIAYSDGRKIYPYFSGEVRGQIAENPAGDGGFGWDRIFIPDNGDGIKTFAELGDEKNKISMRRIALNKFGEFLTRGEQCRSME